MSQPDPVRLSVAESQPERQADPGRMLQILWRGKWILLVVPLLAFGTAKLWLDSRTPLYMATAQVQVDSRTPNVLKAGAGEAIDKPRTILKQQQSLLKSTLLLKRIADAPGMAGLKSFAPDRLGDMSLVGALFDGLQTGIDVESNRLFVNFTSPYRDETVTVVEEALRVYFDYQKEKKKEQASGLSEIVRVEWESTKKELDEDSSAIADLQSQNTLLAGTDRTPLQTKLDQANTAWTNAHQDTLKRLADFQDMQRANEDAAKFRERGLYWRNKGPIGSLEERMGTLEKERQQKQDDFDRLKRSLGEGSPRLKELGDDVARLKAQEDDIALQYAQNYLRSTEVDYRHALDIEASLATDLETLQSQVADLNRVLDRIKDLQIERDALRERVRGFEDRIAQLELENQTGALNLAVIENARAGVRPVYPETEKDYIYALGASGILAFGLVLMLGIADRRVRQVEDVPALLGTSVLGVLPEMPGDRARVARSVEEDPHSLLTEAIRSTRTATTFALPGGRGVVLVTSASSGEGKSVCASNLACALARAGKKTLLVDADMRKPAQHQIYAVENGVGLAGLLTSSVALKKAIVPAVAVGLDLLPAGDARGKAAELCEGAVLLELVKTLRESYECIVVDSPPVLETSEARVLAALSDAVVFVLRLDVSKAPGLRRAAGILRGVGARILGALPNGAASQRGARAYSGGISYGPGGGQTAAGPRARSADEPELDPLDPRARGTDFLGLEGDEEETA